MMYSSSLLEVYPTPPPLPFETGRNPPAERRRVSTESSASSGWAARLAERFPDKTYAAKAKPVAPSAPVETPTVRARCWRIFG
jgi:hypothetical protein